MALEIQRRDESKIDDYIVHGTKTGKIYFAGTYSECQSEIKRRMTNYKARVSRKDRADVLHSLGLVKVKGAVSGRTYWE